MRVFSIVMSWSNENKSCMRVDERGFLCALLPLSCHIQRELQINVLNNPPISVFTPQEKAVEVPAESGTWASVL